MKKKSSINYGPKVPQATTKLFGWGNKPKKRAISHQDVIIRLLKKLLVEVGKINGTTQSGQCVNVVTKQDLIEMEQRMAMTSAQLETLLNNQTTQIGKIATEQSDRFDKVTAALKVLQDLIDAGGAITPAIETASAAVQTALDSLDASIPDAPPTPPVA